LELRLREARLGEMVVNVVTGGLKSCEWTGCISLVS
jgi:hypothetical protein